MCNVILNIYDEFVIFFILVDGKVETIKNKLFEQEISLLEKL